MSVPASAAGATTWVEGFGSLRGELTIGETFATLNEFEVAMSDAVTRIDVPPETRGSFGPVDPDQRLEDEDPWVFIVQTLEYQDNDSRAGQQDLILLVRNDVGWSVGAAWYRDLCHREPSGGTCR